MYQVPVDGYPSTVLGSCAESNLLGGCTPWRCHTLATDSEGSNLAAAAAALVAFRIGPLGMLCDY